MKRHLKTILFITILTLGLSIVSEGQNTSIDQDKKEIDTCIQKLYKFLSYSNGNLDSLASIGNLFTPDAKLLSNLGNQPQSWFVPQFVDFVKEGLSKQSITDRQEVELSEKTEIFGKISHRFSTYKIDFIIKGKAEQRKGINSIQLLKLNGKWQIYSLVWDIEKVSQKIPTSYDSKN